ncbi:histidine kinase [Robertmurraya sp.]|jgi:two-component system, NarL family, sensor histidine kinase DesK|uniref:sensor histidine kinase n=1 Tax=Robertmurraya sp. TaxID=2837525 RepID=UPI003704A3E1
MKKSIGIFPKQFGFFPYIFLVYVLFPINYLLAETGTKQIIGFGLVLLFLITYRQLYFTTGKTAFTYWLTVQMSIIFIFSCFYDLNHIFLGFFPANFIGYYREKVKFKRAFISLIAVLLAPFVYHFVMGNIHFTKDILYFVPFLVIMFISPFGIRSMNRRMELEQKLAKANQHIEELVKREERVRIARDLHDTLGHTLSLLTLKSQLVQRLVAVDTDRARKEAREMEVTSRTALKQVRELVSDMRTTTIAEEVLQVQQILRAAEITFEYNGSSDFSLIPPVTQNIVSMCIREAATNVVKHSKATHCSISISQSTEKMDIIIHDDGMGVEKNKLFGNGLRGMEERLTLIDGGLELNNQHGAMLKITVPIIKKAEPRGAIV